MEKIMKDYHDTLPAAMKEGYCNRTSSVYCTVLTRCILMHNSSVYCTVLTQCLLMQLPVRAPCTVIVVYLRYTVPY
jgi:hypothetical protein